MNFHQTYRINLPAVVSEVFDDEIVIIHLENGVYYSLDQNGALIWELVQQGATVAVIVTKIAARYGLATAPLVAVVQQFIEELCREQLILADTAVTPARQPASPQRIDHSSVAAQVPFSPPHLHKFTDMQDLLLLDPIHDVTETGWPHASGYKQH